MLFLLSEWILSAPQILAKMSLKTESEIAVHGSDGIHVAFDKGDSTLRFYFGEAKIHQDLSKALRSAAKSIASSLKPGEIHSEVELVERHIDSTGLDEEAKEALLSYLDPFDESWNERRDVITSFIAFQYKGYADLEAIPYDEREATFVAGLQAEVALFAPKLAGILETAGVKGEEIEFFLMPLPSVASLRENFQAEIGWK